VHQLGGTENLVRNDDKQAAGRPAPDGRPSRFRNDLVARRGWNVALDVPRGVPPTVSPQRHPEKREQETKGANNDEDHTDCVDAEAVRRDRHSEAQYRADCDQK
jgi:hypothetical protein